jgi:hypothetical protein
MHMFQLRNPRSGGARCGAVLGLVALSGVPSCPDMSHGTAPQAVPAYEQAGKAEAASRPILSAQSAKPYAAVTGIAGLIAALVAFLWRRGLYRVVEPVARRAARTARSIGVPAARVAGDLMRAGASALGAGVSTTWRMVPRRVRWRLIALAALMSGMLLILASGWGAWIALAMFLTGAIGLAATLPPRKARRRAAA